MCALLGVMVLSAGGCFLLPNQPPLPVLQAAPLTGEAPLRVHFDATGSTDADGIVVAYRWSFGDGTSGIGRTIDHTFHAPGTYVARLSIEDNDGEQVILSADVVVEPPNAPPNAAFTFAPSPARPSEPVAFDASASADMDGAIISYTWDFDDGAVGTGPLATHVFPEPGLRQVTLTVTDDDGATMSQTLDVPVSDPAEPPPVARFVPTVASIEVGEMVRLDASSSTAMIGTIKRYEWSFGDGSTAVGATVRHAYATADSYRVTLTVTDSLDVSAQATGTVHVSVPSAPPPDGETISRSFSWLFEGQTRRLSISVSQKLYDWCAVQARSEWPNRDYGDYVLSPLDDTLLRRITQSLQFDCYFRTIKNAFAFVQSGIDNQPGAAAFEYPRFPAETLVDGVGDSEDTAILYGSLIRTLGYRALLAAVDTDQDSVSDHMVALVPVGSSYARYGFPEAWEYRGMMYALAAVNSETSRLGSDPWGLSPANFKKLWDASQLDPSPLLVKQ